MVAIINIYGTTWSQLGPNSKNQWTRKGNLHVHMDTNVHVIPYSGKLSKYGKLELALE